MAPASKEQFPKGKHKHPSQKKLWKGRPGCRMQWSADTLQAHFYQACDHETLHLTYLVLKGHEHGLVICNRK